MTSSSSSSRGAFSTTSALVVVLYRLAVLLLPCLLHGASAASSRRPIRYRIPGKQSECIYKRLAESDVMTYSVFVVEASNNGKLRASIGFEGPVAVADGKNGGVGGSSSGDVNAGEDEALQAAGPRGGKASLSLGREIRQGILSDWSRAGGAMQRKLKVDWTHAGESEDKVMARAAINEQTHEEYRRHRLENEGRGDGEVTPLPMHTVAQGRVEPYEETHPVKAGGWYRLCVTSEMMTITVEMDVRSANEMGGVDPDTGHVWTHEKREFLDEQRSFFGRNEKYEEVKRKAKEREDAERRAREEREDAERKARADVIAERASDEDFQRAKDRLREMHEVTSEIMKSQHHRMGRTRAHDAHARRASAALARSSKVETLLYVLISGVQMYTLRKWLLGNQLGR